MSDDLQAWLDAALHALIIDRQRPLPELSNAYDALEEQAAGVLSEDPERLMRLRRELGALRLTAAKQRGIGALNARALFDRCEHLGYASAGDRVTVAAIFASICLADGHPELERGELDEALRSVPSGRYQRMEELARDLNAAKHR